MSEEQFEKWFKDNYFNMGVPNDQMERVAKVTMWVAFSAGMQAERERCANLVRNCWAADEHLIAAIEKGE